MIPQNKTIILYNITEIEIHFQFCTKGLILLVLYRRKKKSLRNQNPVNISLLPKRSKGKRLVSIVAEAIAKATMLE